MGKVIRGSFNGFLKFSTNKMEKQWARYVKAYRSFYDINNNIDCLVSMSEMKLEKFNILSVAEITKCYTEQFESQEQVSAFLHG